MTTIIPRRKRDEKKISTFRFLSLVVTTSTFLMMIILVYIIINGITIQKQFSNGSQCNMTYSRHRYIPITLDDDNNNNTTTATKYRLLKFYDSRDNHRHAALSQQPPLSTTTTTINLENPPVSLPQFSSWCHHSTPSSPPNNNNNNNPGQPILYIHGHWGSYLQARSLGAHGTRLTGRRLHTLTRNYFGSLSREGTGRDFLYDVYVVDFDGGEGSVWHAGRMEDQANFVVRCVEVLMEACNVPSITIVAHSVGGIIARAAAVLLQQQQQQQQQHEMQGAINTIITLGSPHVGLPYAILDPSVGTFFKMTNEASSKKDGPLVVSISGGWRDELVHPAWTSLDDVYPFGISVLASDISYLFTPHDNADVILARNIVGGMDHKAMVWCHSLLSNVRSLIDVTSKDANKPMEERMDNVKNDLMRQRIEAHGEKDDEMTDFFAKGMYLRRVWEQEELLRDSLSTIDLWSLQIIIPYNLQLLPILYTMVALYHQILNVYFAPIAVALTIIIPLFTSPGSSQPVGHYHPPSSIVILTVIAYIIYHVIIRQGVLLILERVGRFLPIPAKLIPLMVLVIASLSIVTIIVTKMTMTPFHYAILFAVHLGTLVLTWCHGLFLPPSSNNSTQRVPSKRDVAAMGFIIPLRYCGTVAYVIPSLLGRNGAASTSTFLSFPLAAAALSKDYFMVMLPIMCHFIISSRTVTSLARMKSLIVDSSSSTTTTTRVTRNGNSNHEKIKTSTVSLTTRRKNLVSFIITISQTVSVIVVFFSFSDVIRHGEWTLASWGTAVSFVSGVELMVVGIEMLLLSSLFVRGKGEKLRLE